MAICPTAMKDAKIIHPVYGQLVIGPPGSGKSTYCHRMQQFLEKINRKAVVVNLDPANEEMQYKPAVDVTELISLGEAMEAFSLGPNGGLMYCMEFLETEFEWFRTRLAQTDSTYFIFDCPGQVELYTNHNTVKNIFSRLVDNHGFHLCVVQLVDSHYCSEPHKFISTLLMALNAMLQVPLPFINVLSKADQIKRFAHKLDFGLEFYTEVLNLEYLMDTLEAESPAMKRYKKLNAKIIEMIAGFNLVHFQLLDANSTKSLDRLRALIDKAGGYIFGAGEERSINTLLACAVGIETESERQERDREPYLPDIL